MTTKKVTYPGPRALIKYLKGKPRKAKGHFKGGNGGRCCLGHYGDMGNIDYRPSSGLWAVGGTTSLGSTLPGGHWLFKHVKTSAGGSIALQEQLALLNDRTVGYDAVIEELEKFIKNHPEVKG